MYEVKGLEVHSNRMWSWASIKRTVDFVISLDPTTVDFGICTPYPGARLFDDLIEEHKELKDKIQAFTPPGLFSRLARNLFSALILLQEEVGTREMLLALLNNRIKISIVSITDKETKQNKSQEGASTP